MKKHLLFLAVISLACLLFFARDFITLDSDFGWHLTTGKYILKNGIPKTDSFSYTMPGYKWIEYEWASDFIYAFLYPAIGIAGLAFTQAVIIVFALCLNVKNNLHKWTSFVFLIVSGEFSYFLGIRPQIFSWFFFSLIIFIILDSKRRNKYLFLIPFIFIAWVNLHGGFALGIITLAIFTIYKSLSNKSLYKKGALCFLLSILATFINPYTFHIWEVIFNHMTSSDLKLYVSEWQPGISIIHPSLLILLALSAVFIYRYLKKFTKIEIILYGLLLAATLSSIKYAPFWIIIALVIVNKGFFYLKSELPNKLALKRFNTAIIVLSIAGCVLFITQAYFALITAYYLSENVYYPKKAVIYLNNRNLGRNIFSDYNWGGYLIWKMPGRKFFIDGRMPTWKNDIINTSKESTNALADYNNILKGKISLKSVVKKYNIDTIILPQEKPQTISGIAKKLKSLGNKILKEESVSGFQKLKSQAEKQGFKQIYKDDTTIIYQTNL